MNRASAITGRVLPLVAVLAIGACRDAARGGAIEPAPSAAHHAQLVVEPAMAGDSVISVAVRISQAGTLRIGSMTAAITYDSVALRYVGDVSPGVGALRAAHASRGRLMIAAAHAAGFEGEILARVRFVARDSLAYRSLGLQVTELHLLDATDARPTLVLGPVEVVR